MAKKITVSAPDADKKTLEEAYAAWGTTREDHLAKMKKFIEREKAEAGMSHAAAPVVYIDRRAAASRPAALKPVASGRPKGVAARSGRWTLADRVQPGKMVGRNRTVAQLINTRLNELEAQGVDIAKVREALMRHLGVTEVKGITVGRIGRQKMKKGLIDLSSLEVPGVDLSGLELLKGGSEGLGLTIGSGMSAGKRVYGRYVMKGKGGKGGKFRGKKGPKF